MTTCPRYDYFLKNVEVSGVLGTPVRGHRGVQAARSRYVKNVADTRLEKTSRGNLLPLVPDVFQMPFVRPYAPRPAVSGKPISQHDLKYKATALKG